MLFQSKNVTGTSIVFSFTSGSGCPTFSLNVIVQFIQQYSYVFGAIFIVLGLVIALFGNQFLWAIIFIFGTLAAWFLLAWLIFFICYKAEANQSVGASWAILISTLVVGLIVGFLCAKLRRVAVAAVGGVGGAFLGLMITTLVMVGHDATYWIIVIGCAVVCAILTFFLEPYIVMLCTAFAGSYMFIRGISFYAGGFPPETAMYEMIKDGNIDRSVINKGFYGYLAGIAVCFALALWF